MNTRIPVNDQTRNMIIQRTLQAAIDEKLKLQDAEKNGIVITDKDIDQSVRFLKPATKSLRANSGRFSKTAASAIRCFCNR